MLRILRWLPKVSFKPLVRKFALARQGNIAVLGALLLPPMIVLTGGATDYGLAIRAQSRLEQAARNASSTAVVTARRVLAANGGNDGPALAEGQVVGKASFTNEMSALSNLTIITANITVTHNGNKLNATLTYTANQNTIFAKILGVTTIPLTGSGSMVVDGPPLAPPFTGINEAWFTNRNAGGVKAPDWTFGNPAPGTSLPIKTPGNPVIDNPIITGAIQVGGGNPQSPNMISTSTYLPVGKYEFRYWYKSAVVYPEYEPVYICGTVEEEMNWVSSSSIRLLSQAAGTPPWNASRQAARGGVYLDPVASNAKVTTPPDPTTYPLPPAIRDPNSDGMRGDTSTAHNRIDICAYSSRWIQRSIPIEVTTANYYWLTFISEPPVGETSYGFYLGPLQLCQNACAGAVNNNYPWGVNTLLYYDSFEDVCCKSPYDVSDMFDTSSRIGFQAEAKYEMKPSWEIGANRGGMFWGSLRYDYYNRIEHMTDLRAARLGVTTYRRMLLLPGVYRVEKTDMQGLPLPARRWCADQDPSWDPNRTWTIGYNCWCPAGASHTSMVSDEWYFNQANKDMNGGIGAANGAPLVTGGAPAGYANNKDPKGAAMGDCVLTTSASATQFCVLVPRTQYYGFQWHVIGPHFGRTLGGTWADIIYPGNADIPAIDVLLGSGTNFLDRIKVTLVSPGVKNKFYRDASGPGDFDTYNSDCWRSANPTPSSSNIISGGIPMWPGRSVKQLNGIKVTAPLPN